jgi:hypothetical protein
MDYKVEVVRRFVYLCLGLLVLAACTLPTPAPGDGRTPDVETPGVDMPGVVTPTVFPEPEPGAGLLCSEAGVVINPDWKICHSSAYGFEVEYPQEGQLGDQTEQSARIDLPLIPGTNLREKYLQITAAETSETCFSPLAEGYAPGTIPTEPVQLGDLEFNKEIGLEGAAGSTFDWVAYSTGRDGLCISLTFVLRSIQPGLGPTPPPVFDMEEESAIFAEIVSTFRWLEGNP